MWCDIRGGGEFGPALAIRRRCKKHRQKAYDDFQAVAAALVKRGLTTPDNLASWAARTVASWSAPTWCSGRFCSVGGLAKCR